MGSKTNNGYALTNPSLRYAVTCAHAHTRSDMCNSHSSVDQYEFDSLFLRSQGFGKDHERKPTCWDSQ